MVLQFAVAWEMSEGKVYEVSHICRHLAKVSNPQINLSKLSFLPFQSFIQEPHKIPIMYKTKLFSTSFRNTSLTHLGKSFKLAGGVPDRRSNHPYISELK